MFLYWIGMRMWVVYIWPSRNVNFIIILCHVYSPPLVMEIVVIIILLFFLKNIQCRFQTLNDTLCRCLPPGLVNILGQWTHSEIEMSLEKIRLLHAKLSELLKIFSLGCGPLLLSSFVFGFISIVYNIFFIIDIDMKMSEENITRNISRHLLPHVINIQYAICMTSILIVASRIKYEVKII